MWRFLQRPVGTLEFSLAVLLIVMLVAIWRPFGDRREMRQDVRRQKGQIVSCLNNIKQIAVALQHYAESEGTAPPVFITNAQGKPMHSWRVLILPYMEEEAIFAEYDFGEPWDGPSNRKLADRIPRLYRCPADEGKQQTSYVAVMGRKTAWSDALAPRFKVVRELQPETLLLVEVANSGIHWMEPRDLHVLQMAPGINPPAGQGISGNHRDGANVAFVDGSVRFLRNDTPLDRLEAMLTIDGGETFSLP